MTVLVLDPAPIVVVGGQRQEAETIFASLGAYGLALATTLADLGIDLQSPYVGHHRTDTMVTHLVLTPRFRDRDQDNQSCRAAGHHIAATLPL